MEELYLNKKQDISLVGTSLFEEATFDKYRLDDSLLALAYEEAVPLYKAGVKSAIALHFKLLDEFFPSYTNEEVSAFSYVHKKELVSASLYIVDKDFISPALFIAAIMPAIMTKSPVIIVFKERPSKEIMLCIELLGLEQVFCIEEEALLGTFFDEISIGCFISNCIYLGNVDCNNAKSVAEKYDFNFYKYFDMPTIICGKNREIFKISYPNSELFENIADVKHKRRISVIAQNAFNTDLENKYAKNLSSYIIVGDGLEFYYEAIFEQKIFIKEQKTLSFAE